MPLGCRSRCFADGVFSGSLNSFRIQFIFITPSEWRDPCPTQPSTAHKWWGAEPYPLCEAYLPSWSHARPSSALHIWYLGRFRKYWQSQDVSQAKWSALQATAKTKMRGTATTHFGRLRSTRATAVYNKYPAARALRRMENDKYFQTPWPLTLETMPRSWRLRTPLQYRQLHWDGRWLWQGLSGDGIEPSANTKRASPTRNSKKAGFWIQTCHPGIFDSWKWLACLELYLGRWRPGFQP